MVRLSLRGESLSKTLRTVTVPCLSSVYKGGKILRIKSEDFILTPNIDCRFL